MKFLSLFFIVLGLAILLIKEFYWEKLDNNLAPKKELLNEEIRLNFLIILFIATGIILIILSLFVLQGDRDIIPFNKNVLPMISLILSLNGIIMIKERTKYFIRLKNKGYKISSKLVQNGNIAIIIGALFLIVAMIIIYFSGIFEGYFGLL